jgi:hypothetical protein
MRYSSPAAERGAMSEEGLRYAIVVDGIVRTHRDQLEVAMEAASVLKACRSRSRVVIRDLQTEAEVDPQNPWHVGSRL